MTKSSNPEPREVKSIHVIKSQFKSIKLSQLKSIKVIGGKVSKKSIKVIGGKVKNLTLPLNPEPQEVKSILTTIIKPDMFVNQIFVLKILYYLAINIIYMLI